MLGSRLLPVIRNFVAVPAGVARVPALRFGVLTAIGSLLWDGAMALIGYWATVLATFALGTAVGDLTAMTFHLGYLASGVMFIGLFALPGLAYATARLDSVVAFWLAYILIRPLGASFANYLGFSRSAGGIGIGHPAATMLFAVPILALVAYVGITRLDRPTVRARRRGGPVFDPSAWATD